MLRARNLGEADRIFTLFTDERGKVHAVGKGVRRPKSQLAGRLEFVAEVGLGMHRGRTLDVITSADRVARPWTRIVDPAAFATAHLMAELIDAFCEPDLPLPDVYALLRGAIRALAVADEPARLVPRFELRLLGALGVGPQCGACVHCDDPLAAAAAWADVEAGGLACAGCRPHAADALALEPHDVANFRGLAAVRGDAVTPVLQATAAATRAVDGFLTWHLGRRPKASLLLADFAAG